MAKKKKVLIIMPWIKQGGAELIAVQTALQLQRLGHQVKILALFKDLSQMGPEAKTINYLTLGSWIKVFCQNKFFLYFFGPWFLLAQLLKEASWADVLFPQSLPAHWLVAIISQFSQQKIVWLCNEPPLKKNFGQVNVADWLMWRVADSLLDRWFARKMGQIIVYSRAIQEEVKSRYQKESKLIRLGIDFNFFSKSDSKKTIRLERKYNLRDKFILLMVGKLHPQKNQRLAIEVLAQIPQAVLVLVGEGSDQKYLETKARDLGVRDRVIFAGFCRPEMVRAWYGLSDLILFPSVAQTFMVNQSWGFIPFEALTQGKLSIVSQKSGAAEVIKKEKIGFVAPVTVNGFVKAVFEYQKNKQKYQSWAKKGQLYVKNNLSWGKFGREVERVVSKTAV